jgi:hypothetical protein
MTCTDDQIKNILLANPNKGIIDDGKNASKVLLLNLHGRGLHESFKQIDFFENREVYKNRTQCAISNKDLFARLLGKEEMVFTATGGVTNYDGLKPNETQRLNSVLDTIRYGMNIRQWVKNFALEAYRSDPMGVIFIEIDKDKNPYPTYKSIDSIYDYLPNGRQLEYVCFRLTKADVISYGISDAKLKNMKNGSQTDYFRLVDDKFDNIYKVTGQNVSLINEASYDNFFKLTPAFLASDIISFDNTYKFISPLDKLIELSEVFQGDRSIRDLQKKYAGFLKVIEPLLTCSTCAGSGFLSGNACPHCTPPGADKGTGFKLETKVADVSRFSLETLKEGFDYRRIFGYVDVPTDVWNKQDTSLNDIENLMRDVYWGTDLRQNTTTGPTIGSTNIEETATKTLANLQPIYSRLNRTADWAQNTENMIIDFIGKLIFPDQFKKSYCTYGRYYILETPYSLMEEYLDAKAKGASQTALDEALKRYIYSANKDNPIKLAIMLKLMHVEPWIHNTILEVQSFQPPQIDYLQKLYYNEWLQTVDEGYLLTTEAKIMKSDLLKYVSGKQTLLKAEAPVPFVNNQANQQNQNIPDIELQDQK